MVVLFPIDHNETIDGMLVLDPDEVYPLFYVVVREPVVQVSYAQLLLDETLADPPLLVVPSEEAIDSSFSFLWPHEDDTFEGDDLKDLKT